MDLFHHQAARGHLLDRDHPASLDHLLDQVPHQARPPALEHLLDLPVQMEGHPFHQVPPAHHLDLQVLDHLLDPPALDHLLDLPAPDHLLDPQALVLHQSQFPVEWTSVRQLVKLMADSVL
jgi:hypothetical protein